MKFVDKMLFPVPIAIVNPNGTFENKLLIFQDKQSGFNPFQFYKHQNLEKMPE